MEMLMLENRNEVARTSCVIEVLVCCGEESGEAPRWKLQEIQVLTVLAVAASLVEWTVSRKCKWSTSSFVAAVLLSRTRCPAFVSRRRQYEDVTSRTD
jgi:hypothetical protein